MSKREITVNVTEFKAKCLGLLRSLERGTLKRVTVMRRGVPVADVAPAAAKTTKPLKSAYGFIRGSIRFAPGYDPFEQVIEEPKDPFFGKKSKKSRAA
jgi:antitoxin (DNA-binding transcriptional repressor) of toxin-antitoxin stability system